MQVKAFVKGIGLNKRGGILCRNALMTKQEEVFLSESD
jgi:hypothetical protein